MPSDVNKSPSSERSADSAEGNSCPKTYEKQSMLDRALALFRFGSFFFIGIFWAVPFWFSVPFSFLRSMLLPVLPRDSKILYMLKLPYDFTLCSFGYCTLTCLGIRVRFIDSDNKARYRRAVREHQPNIVAYQHVCIADPLIMCRFAPEARFVLKRELKWLFWLFYPGLVNGMIQVSRSSSESRAKCLKDIIDSVQYRRYSVAIAPEGTRNTGDVLTLLPFKLGAFVASTTSGDPIIPIVHWNADNAWTNTAGSTFPRPTLILVEALDPVYPEKDENGVVTETPEHMQQRVHDAMQQALTEHCPDESKYKLSAFDKYVRANIPAAIFFTLFAFAVKCLLSLIF